MIIHTISRYFFITCIIGMWGYGLAEAQIPSAEMEIRPGDKIIWSYNVAEHVPQFGGQSGVTPLDQLQQVIEFDPPLELLTPVLAIGSPQASEVTGTVKKGAAGNGLELVNFTCGAHPATMITVPFKIVAASSEAKPRELRVRARPGRTDWLLATAAGDVIIDEDAQDAAGQPLATAAGHDVDLFSGTWTYRSYRNEPDSAILPNELLFGLARLELSLPQPGVVRGKIGAPDGSWSLALEGSADSHGDRPTFSATGTGTVNGESWVYKYSGQLAITWPDGVKQRPAIVGSVIRAAPHGAAPAGFVASFIAVKQD